MTQPILSAKFAHLEANGIHASRKTIAADLVQLQDCGFDVVCTKSRQNKYFIGTRNLELAELKTIVDAVQAAKFISTGKSRDLIKKLSTLASPHQAEPLKRNLYVDGKTKTNNEAVYYTVDLLHNAINHGLTVEFQYIEYNAKMEKTLKHNGQIYQLSPYDLVWNTDCYYVFGWSESHKKVVKFRVDRMYRPKESMIAYHSKPEEYAIEKCCSQLFMMYDGKLVTTQLRCDHSMMNAIVDRFGEDVKIVSRDSSTFTIEAEVAESPTFFSWVFTYSDRMQILSPQSMKDAYAKRLTEALNRL